MKHTENNHNDNYFKVFGFEPKFGIDRTLLREKFFELSRLHHPDQHTTNSPEAQSEALRQMSFLNKAYSTLQNSDLLRSHVLDLEGIRLESSEKANSNSAIPLELSESWFEISDPTDSPSDQRIDAFQNQLSSCFENTREEILQYELTYDRESNPEIRRSILKNLALCVRKLTYLKSLRSNFERLYGTS